MKILNLIITIFSCLMLSCQTESMSELMKNESTSQRLNLSKCEEKLILQFDTEDLVIDFGQGWQNQSFQTFQLQWLNDNTLKINSYYSIVHADMQQANGFDFQNYVISQTTPFEITVSLDEPSLWMIYGEYYHLFKLNLTLDYCKPNDRPFLR